MSVFCSTNNDLEISFGSEIIPFHQILTSLILNFLEITNLYSFDRHIREKKEEKTISWIDFWRWQASFSSYQQVDIPESENHTGLHFAIKWN